jgi:prepilin-type processing-associated H-X9-DG protein
MKRIRWTWREKLLFLSPLLVLMVPLFIVMETSAYRWNPWILQREKVHRARCQNNFEVISLNLIQYSNDYDGKYPLNTMPLGWEKRLLPYMPSYGSYSLMICPGDAPTGTCNGPTSYWMNGNFFDSNGRGISLTNASDNLALIIAFGDGSCAESSSTYIKNQSTWDMSSDYARRHLDGSNLTFADGHTKWFTKEYIQAEKALPPVLPGNYTFRIK